MANGRANGPAAVSAFDVGYSASFIGMPLINAHGRTAGALIAAKTSTDFIEDVHISPN